MVYIVEGPKYTHKRHQNQLQKRHLNDSNDVPQTEAPIDTKPYPSHHNGLFSPLLVLRDFAAKRQINIGEFFRLIFVCNFTTKSKSLLLLKNSVLVGNIVICLPLKPCYCLGSCYC